MGKPLKLAALTLLILCMHVYAKAQDSAKVALTPAFEEKSVFLSFGVGFANLYPQMLVTKMSDANSEMHRNYFSTTNGYTFNTSSILNREVKFEFAMNKNTGLQFMGNFQGVNASELHTYYVPPATGTVNVKYSDTTTIEYRSLSLGIRFNYHYCITPDLDAYFGGGGGICIDDFFYRFGSNNPNFKASAINLEKIRPKPAFFSVTAGLRLYLSKHVSWYMETGIDKWTVLHTGICIKFKPNTNSDH